jgi:hypothetical protein
MVVTETQYNSTEKPNNPQQNNNKNLKTKDPNPNNSNPPTLTKPTPPQKIPKDKNTPINNITSTTLYQSKSNPPHNFLNPNKNIKVAKLKIN